LAINHREGLQNATWILLDYGNIVVHIFQRETREYYKLEDLWGDAEITFIKED
jgi:ribosome-associated protein